MIKVPDFIEERLSGYTRTMGVKLILAQFFGTPDSLKEDQLEWISDHIVDLYRIALGEEYYANDKYYINAAKGLDEVVSDNYLNWDNDMCELLFDDKSRCTGFQTQFTIEEIEDLFPQYLAKDGENEYYFLERVPESEVA